MLHKILTGLVFLLIITSVNSKASVPTRIKDIASFEGIRDNLLVGYGLVVGLNGSGDNLNNANFTQQGLTDFLSRMGVNVKGANLKTKNIAAVTITANLHAFARHGSRIDVNVSTIGDAKSLEGGTLLATPLLGADGYVYAVAQGSISIAGFKAIAKSGVTISKGIATNGFITNGAIIEKEIDFKFNSLKSINLSLNNPDISTSVDVARIINERLGDDIAYALDPSTINLAIPDDTDGGAIGLLARIEKIQVRPDTSAKIVIEEASGTIVIGDNVRISPVAIAQGNLTIKIEDSSSVSQPNPFISNASQPNIKTVVTTKSAISTTASEDRGNNLRVIEGGSSLRELVEGLNSLGVQPRDLITILQNIKTAGALQAEIETR